MGAPSINPTVQALDDLEMLDKNGALPAEMAGHLADLRMLRDNNALAPAQAPGTGAGMSVEPPNFSPVAQPPAAPAAPATPPVPPGSPEASFVQPPMTEPPGEDPLGQVAGGAIGNVLGVQHDTDQRALEQIALTEQDPYKRARANAAGSLDVLLYRGLRLPESQLVALGYKYGLTPESPLEFKKRSMREGTAGANLLPTRVPEGFFESLGAVTAPTDPFNIVPFGLSVVTQRVSGNEQLADAVQAGASLFPLGTAAVRGARALRPTTKNEKLYREAQQMVTHGREVLGGVQDDRAVIKAWGDTFVDQARVARVRAEIASAEAARDTLARQDAELHRLDNLEATIPTRADDLRSTLGITPGAPTPEVMADMLRRVDREATAANVGAQSHMKGVMRDANARYERARVIGDEHGVRLPLESDDYIALRDRAIEGRRRSIGKNGSAAQRDLALRIQHLGIRGVRNAAGEVVPLDPDAPDGLRRLLRITRDDPSFEPFYDPPTYRELNELHAEAANAALNPRDYGIATDRPAREFYRLVQGQLADTLRTLEQGVPELQVAGSDADVFYRTRVLPMRSAARKVARAETPQKAWEATIGGAGARRDPTHLLTLFQHMDGNERLAHQVAAFDNMVRGATDASGHVNYEQVVRAWNTAHPDWRRAIASGSNAHAQMVMDDLVTTTHRLEEARANVAAARTQGAAARTLADAAMHNAQAAHRQVLADQRRVLKAADHDVREALKGLSAAQKAAERAGRRPVGKSTRILSPMSGGRWEIAAAHAGGSLIALATGHRYLAASQAAIAYAAMRRPRLVAEAAHMTFEDSNAPAIAGALSAIIQGYESTYGQGGKVNPAQGMPAAPPLL